jgi:hypothetical protein
VLEAIPHPLQRRDIAAHCIRVIGGDIDLHLARPQLKARAIDLGRRAVPQAEVEAGAGDIDRRLAGAALCASTSSVSDSTASLICASSMGGTAPVW